MGITQIDGSFIENESIKPADIDRVGLDADSLDGHDSSYFAEANHSHSELTSYISKVFIGSQQTIPYAITTKVNFNSSNINIGSLFNTTNNRVVVPVAGVYEFMVYLSPTTLIDSYVYIYKNGGLYEEIAKAYTSVLGEDGSSPFIAAFSVLNLVQNDYIEIFVYSIGGSYILRTNSFFIAKRI